MKVSCLRLEGQLMLDSGCLVVKSDGLDEVGDALRMDPDRQDLPEFIGEGVVLFPNPLQGLAGKAVEDFDKEVKRLLVF